MTKTRSEKIWPHENVSHHRQTKFIPTVHPRERFALLSRWTRWSWGSSHFISKSFRKLLMVGPTPDLGDPPKNRGYDKVTANSNPLVFFPLHGRLIGGIPVGPIPPAALFFGTLRDLPPGVLLDPGLVHGWVSARTHSPRSFKQEAWYLRHAERWPRRRDAGRGRHGVARGQQVRPCAHAAPPQSDGT